MLTRCGLRWAGLFGRAVQSSRARPRGAVGKDAPGEALGAGGRDAARQAWALPASLRAALSSHQVPSAQQRCWWDVGLLASSESSAGSAEWRECGYRRRETVRKEERSDGKAFANHTRHGGHPAAFVNPSGKETSVQVPGQAGESFSSVSRLSPPWGNVCPGPCGEGRDGPLPTGELRSLL